MQSVNCHIASGSFFSHVDEKDGSSSPSQYLSVLLNVELRRTKMNLFNEKMANNKVNNENTAKLACSTATSAQTSQPSVPIKPKNFMKKIHFCRERSRVPCVQ